MKVQEGQILRAEVLESAYAYSTSSQLATGVSIKLTSCTEKTERKMRTFHQSISTVPDSLEWSRTAGIMLDQKAIWN